MYTMHNRKGMLDPRSATGQIEQQYRWLYFSSINPVSGTTGIQYTARGELPAPSSLIGPNLETYFFLSAEGFHSLV